MVCFLPNKHWNSNTSLLSCCSYYRGPSFQQIGFLSGPGCTACEHVVVILHISVAKSLTFCPWDEVLRRLSSLNLDKKVEVANFLGGEEYHEALENWNKHWVVLSTEYPLWWLLHFQHLNVESWSRPDLSQNSPIEPHSLLQDEMFSWLCWFSRVQQQSLAVRWCLVSGWW